MGRYNSKSKGGCGCGGSKTNNAKQAQAIREAAKNQISPAEYQKALEAKRNNANRSS